MAQEAECLGSTSVVLGVHRGSFEQMGGGVRGGLVIGSPGS